MWNRESGTRSSLQVSRYPVRNTTLDGLLLHKEIWSAPKRTAEAEKKECRVCCETNLMDSLRAIVKDVKPKL